MTASELGSRFVFIVGSPRSGTTYLQRLIASHPGAVTGQESNVIEYVGPLVRRWNAEARMRDGRGGVGLGCYFTEVEFRAAVHGFLAVLLRPMVMNLPPGGVFVEKTPQHVLYLAELNELLPEARIIHLLRDPREVVASLLAASRSWGRGWAPRGVVRASLLWRRCVQAAREARRSVPADRFLEVRYEDLVAAPGTVLRSVMEFLHLSWGEEDIADAIRRNSVEGLRRGEATSIPRSGRFGALSGTTVVDPEDFVRTSGSPDSGRRLRLHQRVCVWLLTRRLAAEVGLR